MLSKIKANQLALKGADKKKYDMEIMVLTSREGVVKRKIDRVDDAIKSSRGEVNEKRFEILKLKGSVLKNEKKLQGKNEKISQQLKRIQDYEFEVKGLLRKNQNVLSRKFGSSSETDVTISKHPKNESIFSELTSRKLDKSSRLLDITVEEERILRKDTLIIMKERIKKLKHRNELFNRRICDYLETMKTLDRNLSKLKTKDRLESKELLDVVERSEEEMKSIRTKDIILEGEVVVLERSIEKEKSTIIDILERNKYEEWELEDEEKKEVREREIATSISMIQEHKKLENKLKEMKTTLDECIPAWYSTPFLRHEYGDVYRDVPELLALVETVIGGAVEYENVKKMRTGSRSSHRILRDDDEEDKEEEERKERLEEILSNKSMNIEEEASTRRTDSKTSIGLYDLEKIRKHNKDMFSYLNINSSSTYMQPLPPLNITIY